MSLNIQDNRLFIDGPQGAGKTSLASFLADRLSLPVVRGIPDADRLVSQSELRNWNETIQIASTIGGGVFDRSILSVWAHGLKGRSGHHAGILNNVGVRLVERISARNKGSVFILIDADPETCWKYQCPGRFAAATLDNMRAEVQRYRTIRTRLHGIQANLIDMANDGSAIESLREKTLHEILRVLG